MKILFLGGTGFVGRHMVSAALNCGHDVTIFTRNKTNSDIFPDVERLVGDRAQERPHGGGCHREECACAYWYIKKIIIINKIKIKK